MRLLLIDTCGSEGSVALADMGTGGVVASRSLPGRSASERLLPEVRELMAGAGWKLRELDAIAVVHGPGSFTGVRVGLSAAKGLSEAGGVGLIAVSRLAVLSGLAGASGRVAAVLDAGRGEFYLGVYEGGRCVLEALLAGDEFAEAVKGAEVVVVCEVKVAEALRELAPVLVNEPVAGDVLGIAVARAEAKAFDDAALIDANYLRRTDLEILARQATAAR
jgi:tRNA threonylcarbamoyladenosine biosynthesis protein TsaB